MLHFNVRNFPKKGNSYFRKNSFSRNRMGQRCSIKILVVSQHLKKNSFLQTKLSSPGRIRKVVSPMTGSNVKHFFCKIEFSWEFWMIRNKKTSFGTQNELLTYVVHLARHAQDFVWLNFSNFFQSIVPKAFILDIHLITLIKEVGH